MVIKPAEFPTIDRIDLPLSREVNPAGVAEQPGFDELLGRALEKLDGTLKAGDAAAAGFLQGKVDIQQMALALEKADISLRFMMHVRNRVVEAYKEISRMNI